ncbi:MAG: DUF1538 domain-containing protein [Methanomicrobiaceae archaeon]|nr:DUF1538 domain-containing protein [Methanomicrobiaceae archaeon]MDD5419926.1 DUF1538 domain-containing protein [Methanomicrobiaceae archaeon]
MLQDFRETLKEVIQAIVPITAVIIVLQLVMLKMPMDLFFQFLIGVGMVTLGIAFFLMGVRIGLLPMGEAIGGELPNRGSLLMIVAITFLLGFLVTVAEPDVRVLTGMIDAVSEGGIAKNPLIAVIAIGIGFFVSTSVLRIFYGVPIAYLLFAGYGIVILLSLIAPIEFVPIAFDAGGVTTGPMTVPIILALGIGVSAVLGGRSSLSDGFGLIGLASIGPVIGVMLMGVFFY